MKSAQTFIKAGWGRPQRYIYNLQTSLQRETAHAIYYTSRHTAHMSEATFRSLYMVTIGNEIWWWWWWGAHAAGARSVSAGAGGASAVGAALALGVVLTTSHAHPVVVAARSVQPVSKTQPMDTRKGLVIIQKNQEIIRQEASRRELDIYMAQRCVCLFDQ